MARPDKLTDSDAIRRRILLDEATRPSILVPFLSGCTLLLGAWAFTQRTGAVVFAGLAAVLVSAGAYFTRILTGAERLQERAAREALDEAQRKREQALDDLERRLVADGDPRTEIALRELRVLADSFRNEQTGVAELDAQTRHDLLFDVDLLFRTCVKYLEKTLDLWKTASNVHTPETRQPLLDQRENLLNEVRASLQHIGRILAQVQTLGAEGGTGPTLRQVRDELDASLEVARRVQARISSWEEKGHDTRDSIPDGR